MLFHKDMTLFKSYISMDFSVKFIKAFFDGTMSLAINIIITPKPPKLQFSY
jgi:hypothetical protein